ncbi:class I SAM-dependent methyltransferase [Parathalassolituus penaei]|uniref:50S ribosomal protein L11 methyltransferase n=1 Tax=Parathalassolituus penaei TaxID=2997323 RepID=A0A9X3EI74_9GAMM|nr:50S ribosomal protein L11 methyltransferase [Parathalassolituus penaei]MCY0967180.1 50S ribosomal protein L11 methyltransferase [Parathalassolituus penaei]
MAEIHPSGTPAPHPGLQRSLDRMLANAWLKPWRLPACLPAELQLWLLDPDCLQRRFSPEEELSIQNHPAYWAICWPAGHALAAFILANPQYVAGKRVLDVGCGSGVVAIAAALAGARQVIASDLDSDALLATQANAALNGVELISCGDFNDAGDVDLLLAADLLYDHNNLFMLDRFREVASNVLVAESRQRLWQHPHYHDLPSLNASTEPDIGLADEYQQVRISQACGIIPING